VPDQRDQQKDHCGYGEARRLECVQFRKRLEEPNHEIDAAINGLIGKGYLEFNDQENLYIYVA
jgi:hypothetical protein